jgi:hypothetical protein
MTDVKQESSWKDGRGKPVCGIDLDPSGKTYTIEVETLSTASITMRAANPEQALTWAREHAGGQGLMQDEPIEYDWPTAKVEER